MCADVSFQGEKTKYSTSEWYIRDRTVHYCPDQQMSITTGWKHTAVANNKKYYSKLNVCYKRSGNDRTAHQSVGPNKIFPVTKTFSDIICTNQACTSLGESKSIVKVILRMTCICHSCSSPPTSHRISHWVMFCGGQRSLLFKCTESIAATRTRSFTSQCRGFRTTRSRGHHRGRRATAWHGGINKRGLGNNLVWCSYCYDEYGSWYRVIN